MLEGLLSDEAAEVYTLLLRQGSLDLSDPSLADVPQEVLDELIERTFAFVSEGEAPRIEAIAPEHAVQNAILLAQQRLSELQHVTIQARKEIPALQKWFDERPGQCPTDDRVRIFTDLHEIARVSGDLPMTASSEVLILQSARLREPGHAADPEHIAAPYPMIRVRGAEARCIYERSCLDLPGAREAIQSCVEGGLKARLISELPAKMILVDGRASLLPLDPAAFTGALLVRSMAIGGLLRALFEQLWERSLPLDPMEKTRVGGMPNPQQLQVLRMLATGMKDEAIARHLRISLRTVRRIVSSLEQRLQAPTRFALATAVARRGWFE